MDIAHPSRPTGVNKSRLSDLFRPDSFRTQIYYRQFQHASSVFLLQTVLDQTDMEKYALSHFQSKKILNKHFLERDKYVPHLVQ